MERSARSHTFAGYRRILWPTDFSALARAAFPHAIRLAAQRGAELVLLHVLPSPASMALPEMAGVAWDRLSADARAAAEKRLERILHRLKTKLPDLHVHAVIVEGVAFDQIHRVARRLRCDLIVLATHGRTGLRHVLMGSVAENVVRRAPCPVLTVRPRALGTPAEPRTDTKRRRGTPGR